MKLLYLDSCIVIYLIEGESAFHQGAQMALAEMRLKGARFAVSLLSLMECRVIPKRQGNLSLLDQYEHFFAMSSLVWLDLSRDVFDIATELRAFQNLKTPDALHLAAAIHHGCTEFWTYDLRLKSAAADRLRIVNPFDSVKE